MAIVGNLANAVKQSMLDTETAVASNFSAQSSQTSGEFDALAATHDQAFVDWLAARDTESARRIAEINDAGTGVKDAKLAEIAAIFGDASGTLTGTETIMKAYRLFIDNDSNSDASLQAAFVAEQEDISDFRIELGIDDADTILALV